MRARSRFFLQTQLTRKVAVLAAPLILQNLSYTLLGVTDTFFVSRVSTEAVAAVGLAGTVFFALMLLFRSTAGSSVIFVGKAHGAKDAAAIGRAIWHCLNMIALLSVVTLALPWLFTAIFQWAAPADNPLVRQLGTSYLQIRAFEVPFVMFNAVVWGFLVGRGNSRTPMLLAWLQVAANILLDWLLVFGRLGLPALGVSGAALATVLANVLIALVSAWILWRPESHRFGTQLFRRSSLSELRDIIAIGLPMGLGDFIEIASFSAFFALIGRISTESLAANNIALQYMSISFTMGIAVAQASSSLVAQALGAGDGLEAERIGYRATGIAMVLMGLVGLSYLVAPEALMRLFSHDPLVLAAGVAILRLVALYQVIDACAIVLGGSLNGAGDTRFTMLTRLIFAWGLFLPLAWLLAFPLGGGVRGAWGGALVYLVSLSLAYFVRFRSGVWKVALAVPVSEAVEVA
jgi:MATE family multidrug resistance protein